MSNLQPNQQLNILFDTPAGEKAISCYIKQVYPDRITLTQPQDWENHLDLLQEGEELKTKVFTRSGVLLYTALVLTSPENDNFTLEYNEEAAKIMQRRFYTRVPIETIVDCEYDKLVNTNKNSDDRMVKFSTQINCEFEKFIIEAETIDIGGGGLKIESKQKLPFDKTITFKINLFDDIIIAQGVLVPKTNLPPLQYGVKFTKIKEEDKDRIIKVCFKIEGILNRKQD